MALQCTGKDWVSLIEGLDSIYLLQGYELQFILLLASFIGHFWSLLVIWVIVPRLQDFRINWWNGLFGDLNLGRTGVLFFLKILEWSISNLSYSFLVVKRFKTHRCLSCLFIQLIRFFCSSQPLEFRRNVKFQLNGILGQSLFGCFPLLFLR